MFQNTAERIYKYVDETFTREDADEILKSKPDWADAEKSDIGYTNLDADGNVETMWSGSKRFDSGNLVREDTYNIPTKSVTPGTVQISFWAEGADQALYCTPADARVDAVELLLLADELERVQSGNPHPSTLLVPCSDSEGWDTHWSTITVANTHGDHDDFSDLLESGEVQLTFARREGVSIDDAKHALLELAHLIAVAENIAEVK